MTEQVVAQTSTGVLGPFEDTVAAMLYLSKLNIGEVELAPVVTPPPMSDLLAKAYVFLKENKDSAAEDFLKFIAGTPEEGVSGASAEEVLSKARELLKVLYPDRSKLTNVQLVHELYKEYDGDKFAILKALRAERPVSLTQARDIMQEAELW